MPQQQAFTSPQAGTLQPPAGYWLNQAGMNQAAAFDVGASSTVQQLSRPSQPPASTISNQVQLSTVSTCAGAQGSGYQQEKAENYGQQNWVQQVL